MKKSAFERTKETRRRKKARKGKVLAGYQQYRLAMLAVNGVPRIKRSQHEIIIIIKRQNVLYQYEI